MPLTSRPYRNFLAHRIVMYNTDPFLDQDTVRSVLYSGHLSGKRPMCEKETLSLNVTLFQERSKRVPEASVRWLT